MSAKWNLFVDVSECTGCRNCFIAVKDEYCGNEAEGYFAPQPLEAPAWFSVEHIERGAVPFTEVTYLPKMCQHCDDAPCMAAAKDGAVKKRADGIVLIDPIKARGQRQLVDACPYGAIVWNEEAQLPQNWPFEAHLLDAGWKVPRVQQACPTKALRAEKLSDEAAAAKAKAGGFAPLKPGLNTRPRVQYRGLERLNTIFVAGSLEVERAGRRECLEGAEVVLERDGVVMAQAKTDAFGDFRLSGLVPGGNATLTLRAPGLKEARESVSLDAPVTVARRLMVA